MCGFFSGGDLLPQAHCEASGNLKKRGGSFLLLSFCIFLRNCRYRDPFLQTTGDMLKCAHMYIACMYIHEEDKERKKGATELRGQMHLVKN